MSLLLRLSAFLKNRCEVRGINSNTQHSCLLLPLFVLHHLLVARLNDYFVTTRIRDWIPPKYTHKLTLHTKTREERCANSASAFIGLGESLPAQQRSLYPIEGHPSGGQSSLGWRLRHVAVPWNSSVPRPLEIEAGGMKGDQLTSPWNKWPQAS